MTFSFETWPGSRSCYHKSAAAKHLQPQSTRRNETVKNVHDVNGPGKPPFGELTLSPGSVKNFWQISAMDAAKNEKKGRICRKIKKGLESSRPLILLVPEVGIEPTRTKSPLDFESSASTNFTTPAVTSVMHYREILKTLSISY